MDFALMQSLGSNAALLALSLTTLSGWGTIGMVAVGLGMVIFIHELGHFAVAKACGVKCEKFYLGFDIFGLKICKFQWGETEYGIGILPLGGYVKMLGQDDNPAAASAEMERAKMVAGNPDIPVPATQPVYDPRSYLAKSVPQRMAIISAGVIMNVIFAFVCATVAYKMGVPYNPTAIENVFAGEPAWEAGLQEGDRIVRVDELRDPRSGHDFMTRIALADLTEGLELEIERPGVPEPIVMKLSPRVAPDGRLPTLGVSPQAISTSMGKLLPGEDPKLMEPFHSGDTIIAADGQPISTYHDLRRYLAEHLDQQVELTVARLSPVEGTPANKEDAPTTEAKVTLPPQPMRMLGLTMTAGPVAAIQPDSPAAKAGIKVGERITLVDGEPIGDVMTLADRLHRRAGETVTLTIQEAAGSKTREQEITLRDVGGFQEQNVAGGPVDLPDLGAALSVTATVSDVDPDSPAAKAGLTVGTQLKSFQLLPPEDQEQDNEQGNAQDKAKQGPVVLLLDAQGTDTGNWPMVYTSMQQPKKAMRVQLETADGKKLTLSSVDSQEFFNSDRWMPLKFEERIRLASSWGDAVSLGLRETKEASLQVYTFIRKLAAGQVSILLMGGPGTIAQAATSQAERGLPEFLIFLTLISANLAVVNFLPIPLLDGGHMVFLAAEGIRGKPVSERIVVLCHYLGFAFVISLMLFVISLDVLRGFGVITMR